MENVKSLDKNNSESKCDDLNKRNSLDTVMSVHHMHCGGACMLKLHVNEGKVCKITSAGDIPRNDSYEKDESLSPIQRRACLMGLSEKRRIFAPDRLKYPLKQTIERGNVRGFKRISWDEALDTIASWYREMLQRKDELGYLPILDDGGVSQYLGPHLRRFGNPSSGNLRAATFGAIGNYESIKGNPPIDVLNSKYIIIWGNDTQATLPSLAFIVMKAKEAGIPVTVVDTRYTDTAAAMGSGSYDTQRFLCVRPGTDSALLAAMANVIFRKGLHDEQFIKNFCFGFYPGDEVISTSPAKHPVTQEGYCGRTFSVPDGQSFVEYLDQLESENGGYNGVLRWAEGLTGVPHMIIEDFAIEYATAKPAFIFSKLTGPQRNNNGMYFSWMLIALSAMTGNINKRGGGYGDIRTDDGAFIQMKTPSSTIATDTYKPILISSFMINDVILHGRDGRTAQELQEDVITMNGIDLGDEAKLSFEMYIKGAGGGNIFNQVPNINKRVLAWKKLKYVVTYERFLSSTAAWSDIVLPITTNFEESYFHSQVVSDVFVVNGPMSPMYEAKSDAWVNEQLLLRLGVEAEREYDSDIDKMRNQWDSAKISDEYKGINSNFNLPSFEEIIQTGNLQIPVPPEKSVIQAAQIEPGKFDTDTGRINFYSPFYAERNRAVLKINRAQYVRGYEGYEDILNDNNISWKGVRYTLQFITPHLAHRALTTYGNLPILEEQRPHGVEINVRDAAERNIEDGDIVYVFNNFGCIKLRAIVTKRIIPGVVSIGQGATYRPSSNETYEAYFDSNNDGISEMHVVAIDVGGCTNSITGDVNSGILDPFLRQEGEPYFCGLGLNAGGALCEVSRSKPR